MIVDTWHPVTHDFGLLRAPLNDVVQALLDWHTSIGTHYRRTDITAGLAAAFQALPPLSMAKPRRLYIQTQSEWTACYQNGIAGSDPFPATSYLATHMGVLGMRVCATPPAAWPANLWEVYAPPVLGGDPVLGFRRTVCAANEAGRWVFEESGTPFEFEEVERYQAKRKRDRFPRALLENYVRHFGIRPFDDDFFVVDAAHPAVLLERTQPLWKQPEYTLEQVVAGVPWQRSSSR